MTVAEPIAKLQTLPQDAQVATLADEVDCYALVQIVGVVSEIHKPLWNERGLRMPFVAISNTSEVYTR